MVKPIQTAEELSNLKSSVNDAINFDRRFPAQVFCEDFRYFKFFTFDEFRVRSFPEYMKDFLNSLDEDEYLLLALDPDPVDYFAKHYDFYGAITISAQDTPDDYFKAMWAYPAENAADSLMARGDVVVFSSPSCRWAMLFDRDADLGVCGFQTVATRDMFLKSFRSHVPIEQSIESVGEACEYAYQGPRKLQDMFKLRENYPDR